MTTFDDLEGLRPALRRALSAPARTSGALPGLGAPAASRYGFAPDPALRAERVRDVSALMATDNPEGAKALAEADVFGALGEAMAGQGLSIDDLADVFASYLGQLWELANGAPRKADKARLDAIAAQARAVLDEAMSDAQRASPRGMQMLSDGLAVQVFVYGITAFRLTQDWKDRTRALAENYRTLGRDMLGLDLGLFTFDEKGLVARSDAAFVS